MKERNLKSNIWKFFIYILTTRRNYIPILSIYFLTLPNATLQQIGLYTGIGWVAGFLFEIPSGYISDKIGHKTALIIAKISLLLSTVAFISGTSLINFILGATFISIGISFTSGTQEAFLHNTLTNLKKEKQFSKIYGKMQGNVSLISVGMVLALPLLTKISIILPIKIFLIFDLVGIMISLLLTSPKIEYSAEDKEGENVFKQIKRFYGTGFYITSIFFGLIIGFMMGLTSYNIPYAEKLGLPIILAGSIMAGSRFVWFVVGHNLEKLKKIKIKTLMIFETIFFPTIFAICAFVKNPYIFIILIAIITGYYHARKPIINEYFFNNFLINKRFKATMLSIKSQMAQIFQSILVLIIGYTMGISYEFGYLSLGIFAFFSLITIYFFLKKHIK